jgi:hypothetical protein
VFLDHAIAPSMPVCVAARSALPARLLDSECRAWWIRFTFRVVVSGFRGAGGGAPAQDLA